MTTCRIIASTAALLLFASSSGAAVLTANVTTTSNRVNSNPPLIAFGDESEIVDQSTHGEARSRAAASGSAQSGGDFGAAGATAEASADGGTGELKVKATAARNGNLRGTAGSATAFAEIRQDFSISGTGFLTSNLITDVAWDGEGVFNFDARTIIFGTNPQEGTPDFIVFQNGPSNGRIDGELVSVSSFFQNAADTNVTVLWSLSASLVSGEGPGLVTALLDASNTGRIAFSTSEGLSAQPTTAGFLSNSTYPVAPIPLPASGLLLLGGLGLVSALRRLGQKR